MATSFPLQLSLPHAPPTRTLIRATTKSISSPSSSLTSPSSVLDKIQSIISTTPSLDSPFYILHLPTISHLLHQWRRHLDPITPFYAVKCNPDPALLLACAALDLGFDCASQAEITAVLNMHVPPSRIVYANPCKHPSHLAFAAESHVNLTNFDAVDELPKIAHHHPTTSLLLRVQPPDDTGVKQSFSSKYGALLSETLPILRTARSLNLNITGVCFHVGTGATVHDTYESAIELSRKVFDMAYDVTNVRMNVLDIGGGFLAGDGTELESAGVVIRDSLKRHFGDWSVPMKLMAEPGRYFAEKAFTLVTRVIGKRTRGGRREYWINDGVYGSMGCILMDGADVRLLPLREAKMGEKLYRSTVFGPTLDSLDVVKEEVMLPEMEVGDWFVSPDMGAYTKTLGSEFNGFSTREIPVHVVGSVHE